MESLDIGSGGSEKFPEHTLRGNIHLDLLKPIHKIPNFILCDTHNLPLKADLFDKVFLYDVIEHLGFPLKALLEIKRILKLKGLLELGTPNALYLPKIIRSILRGSYIPHRDHILTYGKPELNNLFTRAGFKGTIQYVTYRDEKKSLHYSFFVRICPFPALKQRQLLAYVRKE